MSLKFGSLDRDIATQEAFGTLRQGDCFHEMFALHVFVLLVNDKEVVAMEANGPATLPKDGKITRYSPPEEFEKRFLYGTIPGYWVDLLSRDNDVEGWLEEKEHSETSED